MHKQGCDKTNSFAKKNSSSVWEAALLKLRFPRRKRNHWPRLPQLGSVVPIINKQSHDFSRAVWNK